MVRARVYRHDVRCPDCGSNWMRKDGFSEGKQRYCCGDCQRRYLLAGAYRRPAAEVKERALVIRRRRTEGSSLSAIGRVLGYSTQAVSQWVKKGDSGR